MSTDRLERVTQIKSIADAHKAQVAWFGVVKFFPKDYLSSVVPLAIQHRRAAAIARLAISLSTLLATFSHVSHRPLLYASVHQLWVEWDALAVLQNNEPVVKKTVQEPLLLPLSHQTIRNKKTFGLLGSSGKKSKSRTVSVSLISEMKTGSTQAVEDVQWLQDISYARNLDYDLVVIMLCQVLLDLYTLLEGQAPVRQVRLWGRPILKHGQDRVTPMSDRSQQLHSSPRATLEETLTSPQQLHSPDSPHPYAPTRIQLQPYRMPTSRREDVNLHRTLSTFSNPSITSTMRHKAGRRSTTGSSTHSLPKPVSIPDLLQKIDTRVAKTIAILVKDLDKCAKEAMKVELDELETSLCIGEGSYFG